MIKHLIELADYLDSNGKKHYANHIDYAILKVSQIMMLGEESDQAIEKLIKDLCEQWLSGDGKGGLYALREKLYSLLQSHRDPMSLLGEGWSIEKDDGEFVLVNPQGEIRADEGPDDEIYNVAMYFTCNLQDTYYDEKSGDESVIDNPYNAPEPKAFNDKRQTELEDSWFDFSDAPNPKTIEEICSVPEQKAFNDKKQRELEESWFI